VYRGSHGEIVKAHKPKLSQDLESLKRELLSLNALTALGTSIGSPRHGQETPDRSTSGIEITPTNPNGSAHPNTQNNHSARAGSVARSEQSAFSFLDLGRSNSTFSTSTSISRTLFRRSSRPSAEFRSPDAKFGASSRSVPLSNNPSESPTMSMSARRARQGTATPSNLNLAAAQSLASTLQEALHHALEESSVLERSLNTQLSGDDFVFQQKVRFPTCLRDGGAIDSRGMGSAGIQCLILDGLCVLISRSSTSRTMGLPSVAKLTHLRQVAPLADALLVPFSPRAPCP
jgi:hypothetical protein